MSTWINVENGYRYTWEDERYVELHIMIEFAHPLKNFYTSLIEVFGMDEMQSIVKLFDILSNELKDQYKK